MKTLSLGTVITVGIFLVIGIGIIVSAIVTISTIGLPAWLANTSWPQINAVLPLIVTGLVLLFMRWILGKDFLTKSKGFVFVVLLAAIVVSAVGWPKLSYGVEQGFDSIVELIDGDGVTLRAFDPAGTGIRPNQVNVPMCGTGTWSEEVQIPHGWNATWDARDALRFQIQTTGQLWRDPSAVPAEQLANHVQAIRACAKTNVAQAANISADVHWFRS